MAVCLRPGSPAPAQRSLRQTAEQGETRAKEFHDAISSKERRPQRGDDQGRRVRAKKGASSAIAASTYRGTQ
jgi:hypothetical protein